MTPDLMSIDEAAAYLNMSPVTLRHLLNPCNAHTGLVAVRGTGKGRPWIGVLSDTVLSFAELHGTSEHRRRVTAAKRKRAMTVHALDGRCPRCGMDSDGAGGLCQLCQDEAAGRPYFVYRADPLVVSAFMHCGRLRE